MTRAEEKGEGHRLTALKLLEAAAGRGPEKTADVELRLFDTSRVQRIVTYMLLRGYLRLVLRMTCIYNYMYFDMNLTGTTYL